MINYESLKDPKVEYAQKSLVKKITINDDDLKSARIRKSKPRALKLQLDLPLEITEDHIPNSSRNKSKRLESKLEMYGENSRPFTRVTNFEIQENMIEDKLGQARTPTVIQQNNNFHIKIIMNNEHPKTNRARDQEYYRLKNEYSSYKIQKTNEYVDRIMKFTILNLLSNIFTLLKFGEC